MNQRLLLKRPSDGLLTLAGELESARGYLARVPLAATHVQAAQSIVVATIEELEATSSVLTTDERDGSRGLLSLATDLEPVRRCLDPQTLTISELAHCREIVEAVINLLYWAATDLQIRTLPEVEPTS